MNTGKESIFFFNTLTRRKEEFISIKPGKVGLYTCGPTVYDYAHIGNYRAFVFEDILKRWLEYSGYEVTHVMNLTDVDDKTIKGSQAQQISLQEYTEHYTQAFFEDIKSLNIKSANYYPKATEHIPEMVELIKKLIQKGYAYKGKDGSIYYAIRKFSNYGKLSRIKLNELKTSARVKKDEYTKEEAKDFALWKAWSPEDGDVFWETELGKGRPGWHVECTAMAIKYLGATFDIHCGGIDNIFPHHENEIAQSEAATGKKFVNYWLHNEHLLVEGRKMAKKFGNFYTLRDLLGKGHDPSAIRYLLLSSHYRAQFNFTFEALDSASVAVKRLRNFVKRLNDAKGRDSGGKVSKLLNELEKNFTGAMGDDLNICSALATVFDFVREVNGLLDSHVISENEAEEIELAMKGFDSVLGLIGEVREEKVLSKEAEILIARREKARRVKDWATADALRTQLRELGVIIEDTENGVRWHFIKKP